MVKQAEKIVKKSPLLPIYGLIIGLGLAVAAWLLVQVLEKWKPAQPLYAAAATLSNQTFGKLMIAFAIWLVLIGIAYLVVAVMTGRDPYQAEKLPPRRTQPKGRK